MGEAEALKFRRCLRCLPLTDISRPQASPYTTEFGSAEANSAHAGAKSDVVDCLVVAVTQVDVDKADKAPVEQAAATEVYIRGWKVDDVIMGILGECFPVVTSLHTVDLWNVGLSDVTLDRLAGIVTRCRALRTLVLDANPVPSQCYHLFLQVTANTSRAVVL